MFWYKRKNMNLRWQYATFFSEIFINGFLPWRWHICLSFDVGWLCKQKLIDPNTIPVHSPWLYVLWLYFFAILAANFSLFVSFVWAFAPASLAMCFYCINFYGRLLLLFFSYCCCCYCSSECFLLLFLLLLAALPSTALVLLSCVCPKVIKRIGFPQIISILNPVRKSPPTLVDCRYFLSLFAVLLDFPFRVLLLLFWLLWALSKSGFTSRIRLFLNF